MCELSTRSVRLAREAGALTALPGLLVDLAGVHVHDGEFAAAAALIEEADAITAATGNAPMRYAAVFLVAWRGEESSAVREHLRIAYQTFSGIGSEAFAERARGELLATGETVRKRTVEIRDVLTAQESQIVWLAAERDTNPEIASQLFISPRTVEYHLHKVFTKLGVSSRRELPVALRERGVAMSPP